MNPVHLIHFILNYSLLEGIVQVEINKSCNTKACLMKILPIKPVIDLS